MGWSSKEWQAKMKRNIQAKAERLVGESEEESRGGALAGLCKKKHE
jgi:hypothetical protein